MAKKTDAERCQDALVSILASAKASGLRDEDCWPWPGSINGQGYGPAAFREDKAMAHRLVYAAVYGPICPATLCVLHSCDNPPCCNPEHLSLGTRRQNAEERDSRLRLQFGGKHYAAILSDEQVEDLLRSAASTSIKELAARYKIKYNHAWKIVRGRLWKRSRK